MRRVFVLYLSLLAIVAPCLGLFDQRLSSSFESREHLPFLLRYAEWGYLTAPQVAVEKFTDIISLGSHNSRIDMGLVKHSKLTSTEFKGVDGVLGLGFSNVSHKGSLVETLIVGGSEQPSSFLPLTPQKFSVVASLGGAELQLGGYNPDAVVEGPIMLDVLPHDFQYGNEFGYSFALSELKVCGVSLLPKGVHFSALLQAGPVCVGLPANAIGYTGVSPLAKYLTASRHCPAGGLVEIVSQGHTFSFPASQLTKAGGGCVRGHEQNSNFISLGDPFFRNFLVLHDLTDMFTNGDIRVGLARRNPAYNIGAQMREKSDKTGVEHIALTSIPYDLGVRYLANIGVGSPPQEQVNLPVPPPTAPCAIPSHSTSCSPKLWPPSSRTWSWTQALCSSPFSPLKWPPLRCISGYCPLSQSWGSSLEAARRFTRSPSSALTKRLSVGSTARCRCDSSPFYSSFIMNPAPSAGGRGYKSENGARHQGRLRRYSGLQRHRRTVEEGGCYSSEYPCFTRCVYASK
jgi:hypothetical protein